MKPAVVREIFLKLIAKRMSGIVVITPVPISSRFVAVLYGNEAAPFDCIAKSQ